MGKPSYEFALAMFAWAVSLARLCLNIAAGDKGLTMLRAAYKLGKYG